MTSGEVRLQVKNEDGSSMKFKYKKTKPRSNPLTGMVKKFTLRKSSPQSAHMSNAPPTSDTYTGLVNPDAESVYTSPEPSRRVRTLPSLPQADEADVSKVSSPRGEQVFYGQVKKSNFNKSGKPQTVDLSLDSYTRDRGRPPLPLRLKSTSNQTCADTGSRSVADRDIGRDCTYGEEEGEDPTPYAYSYSDEDLTADPDLSVNPSTSTPASYTRDSGPISTLLSTEEDTYMSMTGNTHEDNTSVYRRGYLYVNDREHTEDNETDDTRNCSVGSTKNVAQYTTRRSSPISTLLCTLPSDESLDSLGHKNEEDKVPADPRHCPETEDLGTARHQNVDKTVSQTTEPMSKLPPIHREDPTIKPDQLPQQEQRFICVDAKGWDQLFQQHAAPLKQHLRRVRTDSGAESPIRGKEVEGNDEDNSRGLRLLDLHKDLAKNPPVQPPVNDLENAAAACAAHPEEQHPEEQHPEEQHPEEQHPEEQPLLSFERSISTSSSSDEDYDRMAYLMNFNKVLAQKTGNYVVSTSRPSEVDYLNVKTGEDRDIDEDLNLANDD